MDSLKKRYIIKLARSISDAGIRVGMLLFIPRVLGPASYGSFNFIRNTFQNVIALSDLNLSSAHVNYSSRKEDSTLATNIYFLYVFLIGLIMLLFVAFSFSTGLEKYIFPEQELLYLFLGSFLSYLMYFFTAVTGLSDSKGVTYGFEIRSIVVSILIFAFLVLLYMLNKLTLLGFFIQQIILYLAMIISGLIYLRHKIGFKLQLVNPMRTDAHLIRSEFWAFSYPLITLSIIGIVFGFFERWFLQVIYGSVSQGYFSLAFSLSSIAGLFLAPMTPLLMQSVAHADERGDVSSVKNAFEKVKFLYLIGGILSIFFMFHTSEILSLIGGSDYDEANLTIMVMFLYPIHVVYGQFCGGVLIALRKTRLYRNISLVSTVVGVIITYFLLAPHSFLIPGFELSSLGLALKQVLIQFFSITLQLYFVCEFIKERISSYLTSQLVILLPLFAIGMGEKILRNYILLPLSSPIENILNLLLSMMLWIMVISSIVWFFPGLVGFQKLELRATILQFYTVTRRKLTRPMVA